MSKITYRAFTDPGGGRTLRSDNKHYKLSAKIMAIGETTDGEHFPDVLMVIRLWIGPLCHHYVVDARNGSVVAEGRSERERDSWAMARRMLVARQYLDTSHLN